MCVRGGGVGDQERRGQKGKHDRRKGKMTCVPRGACPFSVIELASPGSVPPALGRAVCLPETSVVVSPVLGLPGTLPHPWGQLSYSRVAEFMVRRPTFHVQRQKRKIEKFIFLKKKPTTMHHNWFINLLLKFCAEYWKGRSKEDPGRGEWGERNRSPCKHLVGAWRREAPHRAEKH